MQKVCALNFNGDHNSIGKQASGNGCRETDTRSIESHIVL